MARKRYNSLKGLKKQGLTSRWLEIVDKAPETLAKLYVERTLRRIYSTCRQRYTEATWKHREQEVVWQLKVVSRVMIKDFGLYGYLADTFIDVVLLSINRIFKNLNEETEGLFQEYSRVKLNLIERIISRVGEHKMTEVFGQILKNDCLGKFLKSASKFKSENSDIKYIYQFQYVARQIEFSLIKIYKLFKSEGLPLEGIEEPKSESYIETMTKFENLMCPNRQVNEMRDLQIVLPNIKVAKEPKLYSEITKTNEWTLIKAIEGKRTTQTLCVKLTAKEGQIAYAMLAISSEPQFTIDTKYKLIDSEKYSIKINCKEDQYVMVQVETPFVSGFGVEKMEYSLNFSKYLPQLQIFNIKFLDSIHIDDENDNMCMQFISIDKQLYLADKIGNSQRFVKLQGFTGCIHKIIVWGNSMIFVNENNIPWRSKDLASIPQIKQSFFTNSVGKKVSLFITELVNDEGAITGKGFTQSGNQVTLVCSNDNPDGNQSDNQSDNWTLKIQEDTKPEITLKNTKFVEEGDSSFSLSHKEDFFINRNYFNIIDSEGQFSTENPDHHSFEVISGGYFNCLYAFDKDNKMYRISTDDFSMQNVIIDSLPEEFQKVNQILCIKEDRFVLDVTQKDGKKVFYKVNRVLTNEESSIQLQYQFTKVLGDNNFTQIISQKAKSFGIREDGQVAAIRGKGIEVTNWVDQGNKALEIFQLGNVVVVRTDSTNEADKLTINPLKEHNDSLEENRKEVKLILSKPGFKHIRDKLCIHFIEPAFLINKVEYGLINHNDRLEDLWKYEETELQLCVEFLNTAIKKMKFKRMKAKMIKHNMRLSRVLKLTDLEGHNPELVQILMGVNEFTYENRAYLLAQARDIHCTRMDDQFHAFADKFIIPQVLFLIQYITQKVLKGPGSERKLQFNRLSDQETIFDQLYRQTKGKATEIFTVYNGEEKPFRARFLGENSYDAGGPFRDIMENICQEVTERYFKPTSNMDALDDVSSHQPRILNRVEDLNRFLLIGKMIGWALQSYTYNLSLDFNLIFWKRLTQASITIEDLKHVDIYRYNVLQMILKGEYQCMFEADLGDGEEQELCEGGSQIAVTAENRTKFAELYLAKYLEKDHLVNEAIIRGIKATASPLTLRMLTPVSGPLIAFSTPKINADVLISQLVFDNDAGEINVNFKQMILDFSNKERQLLLKFITGSSRMGPNRRLYISYAGDEDKSYPIGHTCGESVDCPNYRTVEIMKERFRTAMLTCGEIDDDGDYYGSEYGSDDGNDNDSGDQSDGGSDSSHNSGNHSSPRQSSCSSARSYSECMRYSALRSDMDSKETQSIGFYADLESYDEEDVSHESSGSGNDSGRSRRSRIREPRISQGAYESEY